MENLLNSIRKHLNNENYNGFYNCKNMILILSPHDNRNRKFDCGCIMQNMMLKACELNVANVWINQFYDSYDSEHIRKFLQSIDIDEDYEITCALALGHSEETPKIKPNKFKTKFI
ncbi:MAG: nitroreductase family protein [Finegoldia magna]|nr:nitroreductase family protein [Finegoldia magna]